MATNQTQETPDKPMLGGWEVQGEGSERFARGIPDGPDTVKMAPTDPVKQAAVSDDSSSFTASSAEPSVSSTIGKLDEAPDLFSKDQSENPMMSQKAGIDAVDAADAPTAPVAGPSSYDIASAERQARAGGAATYEEESAARQARAGGAATYEEESSARSARALQRKIGSGGGPDSRDRDRTGRISKDEQRAVDRVKMSGRVDGFDIGRIQSVLARNARGIGGQEETDRQMDQAFKRDPNWRGNRAPRQPSRQPHSVGPDSRDSDWVDESFFPSTELDEA